MASENPLNLVMSEFLPAGAGPDRLDKAFPNLDFGPEKEQFYSNARRTAYVFAPFSLIMAAGEELTIAEAVEFLEKTQLLASGVGFTIGYLKHRKWRQDVDAGRPDSFRCVVEGLISAGCWFLPPHLALQYLTVPEEPSSLWKFWNAAKTVVALPILQMFTRFPKI